jgi:hypothetical protein
MAEFTKADTSVVRWEGATYTLANTMTLTSVATLMGSALTVQNYNKIIYYFNYTRGTEPSVELIPYFVDRRGTSYQWTRIDIPDALGTSTVTLVNKSVTLATTMNGYFVVDCAGHNVIKLYEDAASITVDGTMSIVYRLSK